MLLTPKPGITYGPVNSRRLGPSLGINLFPGTDKVCPFNCVYCQYGWTKEREVSEERRPRLPKPEDVARAVEDALRRLGAPPAYITFSGNGEPTLHPEFARAVDEVNRVRARFSPALKTAILSNSALVGSEPIRRALAGLDVRIMKLDCGTEEVFRRYNGPSPAITLDAVTEGLAELNRLAPVMIQALWTGGRGGNFSLSEVKAWLGRLAAIRPSLVQVYSLDRDTPARNLSQLDESQLNLIVAEVRRIGLEAASFSRS